jgi:hypothetical protein
LKKIIVLTVIIALLSTSFISITSAFEINAVKLENLQLSSSINNDSFDGYILFSQEFSRYTYLINNDKEIVHKWKSKNMQSLTSYLLENGSLLRSCYGNLLSVTWGGGFTGRIEMFDWDGNLIWEYTLVNFTHCLHNDIEPLPNGNILMIVWERKTKEETMDAGCNPDLIRIGGFRIDHIIEVEPTYPKGGNIVWEWHIWDHLIQDYDPAKENYGKVEDHPELVDINYRGIKRSTPPFATDFSHMNSLDYIEEFDQILVSVRNLNEIYIIDHSTTTEEAATHTGGKYGKGGDILYRWGNPQVYRAGDVSDQKFFAQHDPRWIEPGYPGERHITFFNNGVGRPGLDYSSVEEFVPPVDSQGNYYLEPGSAYGPKEPIWVYGGNFNLPYSIYLSGAQRIPNGDTLICSGVFGSFLEVTPEKEVVWRYYNSHPLPIPPLNSVFKFQYYPKDYPGLNKID